MSLNTCQNEAKNSFCSDGNAFFAVAYQHGMGRYSDIIGIQPNPHLGTLGEANYQVQLRKFFDVMEQYGDGNKPVWTTETSGVQWIEDRREYAKFLVKELRSLSSYANIEAAIIYNFREVPPWQPAYWAVREYLTGEPPPE